MCALRAHISKIHIYIYIYILRIYKYIFFCKSRLSQEIHMELRVYICSRVLKVAILTIVNNIYLG